jgi:hypothetical protein
MDDINKRYAAFLPGVDPAYAVPVTAEEAIGKVLYMLKSPQSEHRVWPIKAKDIDPDTDEVFERHTGRFKQKKRALRPGDLIKMCKVLADKYLDRLAFAGGAGVPALDAIRAEALKPLRQHEAREAARRTGSGHQDRGHRLPRY